jgi:LPS export ABC transporter protein LptC
MARGARFFSLGLASGLALASLAVAPSAHAAEASSVLRLTGITFVGSRGSEREIVLRSRRAVFRTADRTASLEDVNALVTEEGGGRSFSMTCQRAELNIETNDFSAEGDVQGETGDGQRYWAPWVRYDHEEGLLYTDAPVRLVDAAGTFRGDGFRYYIRERRFRLLENVRVEQLQ